MNIQQTPFAAIAIAALTLVAGIPAYAASIVKATYSHKDNKVALMIYTGSDGGPNSNRADYWKLLGKAPESAYEVKIKPDEPRGKVATLAGDIKISVEIRNQFSMRMVKTDKLTLVRDDADSTRWYIPAKELTRIVALIEKEPAKRDPKAESGPRK
jgi:hypothetical protein